MNKIVTNTIFMLVAVIFFVVLGNLFVLSSLSLEIKQKEHTLESKNKELENLKKSEANTASETQKIGENIMLNVGQEGQLMSLFINENLQKVFKINTYDLYSPYTYKPEDFGTDNDLSKAEPSKAESNQSMPSNTNANGGASTSENNIPQLDENGMPLNASTEDIDTDDWEGLNILPVKLTFSTKPKYLSPILKNFQQFPVNTVRAADFIYSEDNKTVSGTLVFAFPLNEEK